MSSGKAFIENLLANGGMSAYNKQAEKAANPAKAYIENNISEFSKNKSNKTPLMSKSAEKPSIAQAIPFVADQTAKSDNMFKQAEDVHNKAYADAGQAFSKYGNSEAFRASLVDNDANYRLGDADEESKKVYTNTVSSLYTESFLRELSENPTIENYNKFVNAYNTKPFAKAKIGDMDALDFASSIMYAGNSEFRNRKINTEIEKYNDEIKKNEKEIEDQQNIKTGYEEKSGNWFNDAVGTVVQLGAFVGAKDVADEDTEHISVQNIAKDTSVSSIEVNNNLHYYVFICIICIIALSVVTTIIVNYKKRTSKKETFCTACGTKLPTYSEFCHVCGKKRHLE